MNVRYWLQHPKLVLPRVRYYLWERRNPDKPWLCPGTIRFCEQHCRKDMDGLEFGSGRSTRWFASKLHHLTSIEHNAQWYERVKAMLNARNVTNVDYRLIPLNHPETEPERDRYDPLPAYVAVLGEFPDGSFDFIVVDGHYRTTCVQFAIPKLRAGGFLLVDDINLWQGKAPLPVPKNWALVDESSNGLKVARVWQNRPTRSS